MKQRFSVNKLANCRDGDSHMCVHWYFEEHFSELSYRFFSKSEGRIACSFFRLKK